LKINEGIKFLSFIGVTEGQLCANWKLPYLPYKVIFLNYSFSRVMAEWGKGDPRWIVEERPDGMKNTDIFFYLNSYF
jgi:hypothetical protein